MAIRIPTPEYQGAQRLGGMQAEAADTPFQDLRLPDTTFNARMLQQIGGKGVEFAEYLQQQADERGLLELQAGMGDWERQLLYGEMSDGSPSGDPGILGLEERGAFGVADRVQRAFDANLLSYDLTGLSRNGRLAAQQYTQRQREALLNQVTRHEFNQRQAYNNRLRRAAEASAASQARTAWASPESMAASEQRLVSATINRATSEAASISAPGMETAAQREAYVDAEVAASVERFRRDAIERAIAAGGRASVARGREMYDQSIADGSITIESEDDPIVQIVTFGEQIDVVVNGATEIFEMFPDDLGAAITEARRRNYDGDTEQDLVNEITRRFQTAEVLQARENEQVFDRARLAANAGTLNTDFSNLELFRLSPAQRTELQAINSRSNPVGDNELFNQLRSLPDSELAAAPLEEYGSRLNIAEYNSLVTQRNTARASVAGDLAARAERTSTQNTLATVNAGITGILGVDAGFNANAAEVRQRLQLTNLVDDWIYEATVANGRPPTPREITDYISSLNEPVAIGTGLFGGTNTAPRWQILTSDATVALAVEGVPPADVVVIARVLASRGQPVTRDTIRALYDAANR